MNQPVTHRGALAPGTQVQEYEFQEVLGHGGFGITYRGWNTLLQQVVAIKEFMPAGTAVREADRTVLPRSEEDEKDYLWGLDRFLGEAQTLARFDHPCIVRVQHFFQAHGTGYIVMEHLEGQTLGALYGKDETMEERRLRAVLTPLLEALDRIHEANFLHRDIKPGNIMFRGDSTTPVLIDFGAARAAIAMRSQTMTAIVTPGYSPIEQYSTSGEDLQGAWTDIYALGAVLYRGMTGATPNDATDRTLADRLQPTGEAVRGRYSRSLVDAVDWALRVRVEDRPQSIQAWRETLEKGARPPPPSDASAAKPRRGGFAGARTASKTRMRVAALGIVAVLAAGGLGYLWDEIADSPSPPIPSPPPTPTGTADEPGTPSQPDAGAAKLARLVEECQRHQAEKRNEAALACYEKVLELQPGHAAAAAEVPGLKFKEAMRKNTVEVWSRFEQTYPGTGRANSARFRLQKLEEDYWKTVQAKGTRAAYERYLEIYPKSKKGRFTDRAEAWLKRRE